MVVVFSQFLALPEQFVSFVGSATLLDVLNSEHVTNVANLDADLSELCDPKITVTLELNV